MYKNCIYKLIKLYYHLNIEPLFQLKQNVVIFSYILKMKNFGLQKRCLIQKIVLYKKIVKKSLKFL